MISGGAEGLKYETKLPIARD